MVSIIYWKNRVTSVMLNCINNYKTLVLDKNFILHQTKKKIIEFCFLELSRTAVAMANLL